MANVRLKRGRAETLLARALWHRGYRYRLNDKRLPGSPDIALHKYRIAIFVDGEFWHGQNWEERKARLRSNREYWIEKIEENIDRDLRNDRLLDCRGWASIHFWEKDVLRHLDDCVKEVEDLIIEQILTIADEAGPPVLDTILRSSDQNK